MNRYLAAAAAALLLVALVLGGLLAREYRLAAAADRRAEAARLELAGLVVAKEASERDLRSSLEAARQQVVGFAEALSRAQALSKGRPVAVARGSTGPVAVESAPSPRPQGGAPGGPECVLRAGDRAQIEVASAELRTEAGNRVLVAAAEADRLDPDGTRHRLFGGELRSDLTRYFSTEVAPPRRPGLGLGALAVCAPGGCSFGALVSPPPVLGGHLELAAGGFGGRAGAGFQAQVLFRF